eukprot:Tbor_TRINITY_DN5471_c4_g5::TRINITY_DN5471_c4_g5_i2::g.24208::m.24208
MTHLSRAQVNHMAIKEQEQLHRQRRQEQIEEENRQKELINKQRNKYNHVNSKGYGKRSSSSNDNNNNLKNNNNSFTSTGPQDDVKITVFVRECDSDGYSFVLDGVGDGSNNNDNLQNNKINNDKNTNAPKPLPPKGHIPPYLQKIKAELQVNKQTILDNIALKEAQSNIPHGHRIVSDTERKDILYRLGERQKELESELGRIPIRFDTMSIRARRERIEEEMREVEEGLRKFGCKKELYVPI